MSAKPLSSSSPSSSLAASPRKGPPLQRGQKLRLALALALLAISLRALAANPEPAAPPAEPFRLCLSAVERGDGGQIISSEPGGPRPNELSALNCGRQIDLRGASPELLAALPGLGPSRAQAALKRGRLTDWERERLGPLFLAPEQ